MKRFIKMLGLGDAHRQRPAHFALGLSLGMLIGILPKDSLLPYAIGLVALLAPVSLGATTLAILAGLLLGTAADGVADAVGESLLSGGMVTDMIASVQPLPLVPWLQLDNTVVLGLLVIGSTAAIPVYLFSHWMFRNLPDDRFDDHEDTEIPSLLHPSLQES